MWVYKTSYMWKIRLSLEKYYLWNPATCSCKNGKYLENIMDDSVIRCDEIIEPYNEETKTIPLNFNKKIWPVKYKISIFCLSFYYYHYIIDSW